MTAYQKRCLEYCIRWVNGESKHNDIDDECVPDFSCCYPELFEQDRSKRIASLNRLRRDYNLKDHCDA